MTPMEQSDRKGLVERLRGGEGHRFAGGSAAWAVAARRTMREAADMLEADGRALSSDAAPRSEEVKTRTMVNRLHGLSTMYEGVIRDTTQDAIDHIDDLTRKVAEAERDRDRARNTLSLHAGDVMSLDNEVLAMREQRDEAESRLAVLSRPSPGPERKDGWWVTPEWRDKPMEGDTADIRDCVLFISGVAMGHVFKDGDEWRAWHDRRGYVGGNLPAREEAQRALLASVRPKQEGV